MRFVSWSATAQDSLLSRSERLRLLLLLWACGQRGCGVHHVHSPGGGDRLAPDRHWCAVGQRLMRTPFVIKGAPRGYAARSPPAAGGPLEIAGLLLQRPPQPFNEHVVHPATAAVHGDRDAGFSQRAGEG